MLPFTREQFFDVFASYNLDIWPAQLFAYVLGLAAVAALSRPGRGADLTIAGVLAAMWSWTGVVYHGLYFSTINKPALAFGAMFVLQGSLVTLAVYARRLHFEPRNGAAGWLGWALLGYASILYPLIGEWSGHEYPDLPMFGVTPCPLTLFTFGLLLLAAEPVPRWLLVLPFAWSLVGGSAAFLLGIAQDWLLLGGGIVATGVIVLRAGRPVSGGSGPGPGFKQRRVP